MKKFRKSNDFFHLIKKIITKIKYSKMVDATWTQFSIVYNEDSEPPVPYPIVEPVLDVS
jgi:hypothetical protein